MWEDLPVRLGGWWEKNRENKNKWRTPVGAVVKRIVEEAGNWRNAARGNPAKGFRAGFGKGREE